MGRRVALVALTQQFRFRAVHSLHIGEHKESLHGHDYYLEVTARPELREQIYRAVADVLLPQLDRTDLAKRFSASTGEVLVEWIHSQFDELGLGSSVLGVALQETRKNRFVSARTNDYLM